MEHLELLINRSLLLFFIVFFGCTSNESVLMIHEGSNDLDLFKINITYRGKVYSGMIYNTNNMGDTISIGEYKNGLKNGLWKKFYSNGRLKEKRSFKNGLKVGLYEGFYNNGAKNFVFNFKNGEYNGTNRLWAKNGQIIEEFNYVDGLEKGSQKVWYLNGRIKSNYIIKNNRRYGLLGTKNCTNVSEEVFDM